MGLHPSGYYEWLNRPLSDRGKEDQRLTSHIKEFWLESRGHSGYRKIHNDLIEAKISCGRDWTLRLMRIAGLRAVRGYKPPKGCYAGVENPIAANELQQQLDVEKTNRWWVSDISYLHTHEGFLFLAVVMDLDARNIVGWSLGSRIADELVMDALTMAYLRRKPAGMVILQSDQGSQYTSGNRQRLLKSLGIRPSMSRRGNCHDNAVAKSFLANLKKKVRRKRYRTRAEARGKIFEYLEMLYNR